MDLKVGECDRPLNPEMVDVSAISKQSKMGKNIGFIATRLSPGDGVSLEAAKCAEIFEKGGHRCFWFAGSLDRPPERSCEVPEASVRHAANQRIDRQVFGLKRRDSSITDAILELKDFLKKRLNEFIQRFRIDLIIAENVLTLPLHIPLGLALTEIIAETQLPTIAHHHDFYWERPRFQVNAVGDYLRMAFPPNLSNIEHVVINSAAREELALRTGISSTIVPNVQDFDNPPVVDPKESIYFRRSLGLKPDDILMLQPTAIVQHKGIEHAVQLVEELGDPRCKLVISHAVEAEGGEYASWLKEDARNRGVDLRILSMQLSFPKGADTEGRRLALRDIFPHADFITYPSLFEGFGSAFLDAVYFRKPLLINRYANFVVDIEPKGFDLIVMDGYLTHKTVEAVRQVLTSPERRERMVTTNYEIGALHYSYAVLERCAGALLSRFFGV